jgi:hypothetical protein
MVQERYLVTPVDERYEETAKGLIAQFGLKKICLGCSGWYYRTGTKG